MVSGIVKYFDNRKGYGFISDAEGKDYFFHYSDINSNKKFKTVGNGQTVTFGIEDLPDSREKATNVTTITE